MASEHDDVVRRSFERQVALFAGPDSPFARRTGTFAWIEPLNDDMIVLDVACGAAQAAEQVAPMVRAVVGVDLTRALLQLGADRLRENGVSNIALHEGDAESLPYADESFDIVFCRSALHHFAHPQHAVDEMVSVCRRGGRVVLMDLVAPHESVRDRFDHVHRLLDPSHVRSYVEDELPALVPGGVDGLTFADTFTLRLPVDIAITEQSEDEAVRRLLEDEIDGAGEPTGLEPAREDGNVVVDFTMCVIHSERR